MPKIALLLFLLLTGCGSVPMAPAADDAAGKSFSPPAAGSSVLYVYRTDGLGRFATTDLSAGQRMLGSLVWNTWLRIDMQPGTYDVRCKYEDSTSSKLVTLAPGDIQYLAVYVTFRSCNLEQTDASVAQPAIRAGQRAAEIR